MSGPPSVHHEVLAIIPARSGSKGIPNKNIRPFKGKPLLAHSIEHARTSQLVSRVVVSTDSPAYAEIAIQYGAEVPFLRPVELAGDLSTDLDVFVHLLTELAARENYYPEVCVHLRPTYPLRKRQDIDGAVRILLDRPEIDSVRSVAPAAQTPFKMWLRDEQGLLTPVVCGNRKEAHSLPRQALPVVWIQNACVDVIRTRVLLDVGTMTGEAVYGYAMDHYFDIDTAGDWRSAENTDHGEGLVGLDLTRTFCIDIDGVIATLVQGNEYEKAAPIAETVAAVNELHGAGHRIILFTARGSATGIDWRERTERQMKAWGVRYHELRFGKPAADFYVDDRLMTVEQLCALTKGTKR